MKKMEIVDLSMLIYQYKNFILMTSIIALSASYYLLIILIIFAAIYDNSSSVLDHSALKEGKHVT
jgi:hypothetical protein